MPRLKSHKTVEQIAKKHRLDVSFIQKQLDMGEPIEHEHTKDHKLARDIALQHLDEIPDYYTRLKKMEASAKKNHKKFKDVKEETKSGDESLRDWFKKSSGTDPKTGRKVKGWVQLGGPFAGAPCARQPGQTSTPKCGSSKMAANLSPEEEEKAFRRKNRNDPNQPEKKNASKPTNVRTEEMDLQEKKKSGKKDACYNKVKSRYDVWPSAYASGALVKCRKVGAANWGTKSEETMHEEERYCPLCDKRETRSECSYGEKAWDKVSVKDEEYSMARSELKTIENAVKRLKAKVGKGEGDLEAWVQSKITKAADYIDTAADYIVSGEMTTENVERGPILPMKEKGKRVFAKGQQPRPTGAKLPKINKEETLVDKILGELQEEDPCRKGYKEEVVHERADFWHPDPNQDRKLGGPGANQRAREDSVASKSTSTSKSDNKLRPGESYMQFAKRKAAERMKEDVTIEDADGNTFAEVVDIIKPEPIRGFKSQVSEATRLQAQTGNVIAVTLSWRGKYYSMKMFFPQVKTPSRKEINDELQKVYPGSVVIYHSISEIHPGQPLIQMCGPQGGSSAKPGPSRAYIKTMGEEVEISEAKKSEMKCNNPKAEAHGSGETGKSHVVKACEGGEEKLIRFGQLGVKGSPKKKGESEEYASRRHKFKTRHAKNIAKGKMSAAFWSNKVKW
jgi:hypothetical protein